MQGRQRPAAGRGGPLDAPARDPAGWITRFDRRPPAFYNYRFLSFHRSFLDSGEIPMYAVIKTGGKQYKVSPGDKIKVEQIPADIGADIQLDQVLAVGNGDQIRIGAPLVGGAAVSATVLSQGRHPKVRIFKLRRRKHYQKHQGHRQNYTELLIAQIASDLGVFKAEDRKTQAQDRAESAESQSASSQSAE
jgi:large subunit ribosomal protein L21